MEWILKGNTALQREWNRCDRMGLMYQNVVQSQDFLLVNIQIFLPDS
jgi:hypothetical protein